MMLSLHLEKKRIITKKEICLINLSYKRENTYNWCQCYTVQKVEGGGGSLFIEQQ